MWFFGFTAPSRASAHLIPLKSLPLWDDPTEKVSESLVCCAASRWSSEMSSEWLW